MANKDFAVSLFYRKRHSKALSPKRVSDGSFGFDVYADKTVVIEPQQIKLVPTGLIVKAAFKFSMIALVPRSSLAIKKGLMMPNSIGIIDDDYCGEDDELKVPLYNFSSEPVTIKKGERIAQLIIFKIVMGEAIEYPKPFKKGSRGGFGSTGGYKK